jgi:hypothetical protein
MLAATGAELQPGIAPKPTASYRASAVLPGAGHGQGTGACAHPAAARMSAHAAIERTPVWVVILEMLAALALLLLIVWWTWPKKPRDGD